LCSAIIFSASEPYFGTAEIELLSCFPGAQVDRIGPDAGSLSAHGVRIADVAERCRGGDVAFVRHLMDGRTSIPSSEVRADPQRLADAAGSLVAERGLKRVAVQAWGSGVPATGLRQLVVDALESSGTTAVRGGEEDVLGICATARAMVIGLTKRNDALCDWPGGRLKLAASAPQVSRAEFKLEELLKLFQLPSGRGRRALDLGASPGGWTRVLLANGYEVWAVDPAPLDPRVMADHRVVFKQTTAGRFLRGPAPRFHLLVNDMRMTPELSSRVMVDAAAHLTAGGYAVMTLKISPKDPLRSVRRATGILGRAYEIVFLRQLFHNRHEITLVGRRRRSGDLAA
jgi:23S rRNA (cytidine2498-2'-O)-methyltransferase